MKRTAGREFLKEVSSIPLQQSLRHQERAMSAFFSGACAYPRFKSRTGRQSATYTGAGFRLEFGRLTLGRMYSYIRFVWSWPNIHLSAISPTSVTVSREPDGRWYVSFSCEVPEPEPLPSAGCSVGVDLGLKDFAVLSTGEKIAHPRHMEAKERRLKRYQRMMARKQRGSANRAKAKQRVARAHSRVRDARRDFLHKLSTRVVRENDVIAIEDLAVANMAKNPKLSKAISRSGWGEFRSMLEYKAERAGRTLAVANRFYPSSKTCSSCGHLLASLSLSTRKWTCPSCGTRHDRDVNAAKNLLVAVARTETQNARGGAARRAEATRTLAPMKQENREEPEGHP